MTTTATTPLENKEVTVSPALVAQCHSTSSTALEAIPVAVGAAFRTVEAFLKRNNIRAVGPPRLIYTAWSASRVEFTAGIPIAEVPTAIADTEAVKIAALPECRALRFVHRGAYSDLPATYARIESWLRARGGIKTAADWARYSPMWEEYENDPETTPPSELVTHIFLTLR